jgi:glycerophosphoryl diester phosphodiesterase
VTGPVNPWLERRVLAYAHQGGAREAPSSTLFAMRQAVANGADSIELDVHATADGHIVVCHDATVDATTDAGGAIADLTLAELRALDNAYWFVPGEVRVEGRPDEDYIHRGKAPHDPAFGICTLEAVLRELPDVFLNFDIKQTTPVVRAYEPEVARVLQSFGRADDVIVASFNDDSIAAFASAAPEINTAAGTLATFAFWSAVQNGEPTPDALARRVALQVPADYEGVVVVDERFVTRAHEAGLAVHVWTIDDADEASRLVDLDVDAIMTDCPTPIVEMLRARSATYSRP